MAGDSKLASVLSNSSAIEHALNPSSHPEPPTDHIRSRRPPHSDVQDISLPGMLSAQTRAFYALPPCTAAVHSVCTERGIFPLKMDFLWPAPVRLWQRIVIRALLWHGCS